MSHIASDSFNQLFNDFINQISSSRLDLVESSTLKPKASGPTKIDINITLSNNNTQSVTSVSYSNELAPDSVRDLKSLIEIFVRDVEEEFGQV